MTTRIMPSSFNDACRRIRTLETEAEKLKARVIVLEQVISEKVYPENCSDDINRMILESAINNHTRRIYSRAALSSGGPGE